MAEKKLVTFDFFIRSSPAILYYFLTTPEGLTQWFADHVDSKGDEYTFEWDGTEEEAHIVEQNENVYVRFQMEEHEEGEYVEFRIEKAEISNDTILFISEFLEDYEVDDQQLYWNTLMDKLRGCVGGKN